MIYQCYFKRTQEARLFLNLPYRPFGLAPEVNPHITRNCPELDRPEHRLQLCEFVAMLHLWRNPPDDGDDWIGFTSYRQLDKVPTIFMPGEIEAALRRGDAVTWGRMQFNVSMATQCDWFHPRLMPFMIQMFRAVGLKIPQTYFTSCEGIFASYWAVRKTDFQQHMEWFYPAIDYCLKNLATDLYLRSSPRAASYALERMFMAWCWLNGKRVINYYTVKAEVDCAGNVLGVSSYYPRRYTYEAEAMLQAELAEWPDFVPAWLELAEVYLARGRWDQLEQTVQRLEKEFRRVVDAMAFRARGHLARKEFSPALQLLQEAVRLAPWSVPLRLQLCNVLLLEGRDKAAAEQSLRDLLQLDPSNAQAQQSLAQDRSRERKQGIGYWEANNDE